MNNIENELKDLFDSALDNQKVCVRLVDAVPKNYQTYDLIVTDNVIPQFEYVELWPEYWGLYSYNPQYENVMPTRLFNCFINRTDPVRQSWFYQLVRRNLLDQGSVSFLLAYNKHAKLTDIDVDNKAQLYQWVFDQGLEIFRIEHELMRTKVPFCNFSGDLDQAMCDSKISLIIETYFDYTDVVAFSEKIFRGLQLPRPWLLYCSPGAVKILRDIGFDVYDDLVDHSYDHEVNHIARQVKILDELEKFKHVVYNQQMLHDFECRAEHNRQLLKKLQNDWPTKLKNTINKFKHK